MVQPRILFIDAYDSFSNNIITLVEGSLGVSVTKLTIDSPLPSHLHESYAGIIIGPGPGSPYEPADVGCIQQVWSLPEDQMLPVLGICLGFQSLVVHFGGAVERLPYPRHGIETDVQCCNDPLFVGIPTLRSVQYHSLHGVLGHTFENGDLWDSHETCPELVPLAWDIDHTFSRAPPTPEDSRIAFGRLNPTHILMSVKHETKPFYGVQFHPESVCSSPEARQVINNWWKIAKEWTSHRLISQPGETPEPSSVLSKLLDLENLSLAIIRDALIPNGDELIVLDSEMAQNSPLGNYSILGLVYPDTLRVSYSAGDKQVRLEQGDESTTETLGGDDRHIFTFLKTFMESRKKLHGNEKSPFWGGLMGYIGYEACLETLGIKAQPHPERPDLQFAFVERSIVIDHTARQLHVQSIKIDDQQWVNESASILGGLASPELRSEDQITEDHAENCPSRSNSSSSLSKEDSLESLDTSPSFSPSSADVDVNKLVTRTKFTIPDEVAYTRKIRECKTEIQHGNSYELCLTDQTKIDISSPISPWARYLRLRRVNPAPFGAFIRLGPITVLSSSPERFLSWTRPNMEDEVNCQFRPIKGTVKKRHENPDGSTRFVNIATAKEILASPKERAESLMIVDLIRHDLTGAQSRDVRTTSLMQVEEYESVYQLVTVIEGTMRPTCAANDPNYRPLSMGIDVLAASLPPGSMTGAPKKRSCQLLRGIEEEKPRSIYSGVLGYMDVRGGGDFSVVIRTAYRWDDETTETDETWRIGAGGAITDMSQELAEWDEMHTKVDAVLRSFKLVNQVSS
ncbi:para-aminobenzoate synthase (PABA) [Penicillium canescens]|uniref:aminodeoxychorismate synthase n=1 Tax=Penicillium canescens TaxID=5083 RepID=A0AAD6N237_PENCN|nr:para-aminobenzoate synthase (PABA) [Penicillium canescens]KAJ6022751.1 para-aminobenzoate synthase (PABA) [Penicillium canescens]KAJ6025985.1 para-aminobenzoate synthase (PABA) [Penicillium canescens]KAJ6042037.1 para-aminobenzoate synthase (PABA) [Penicillium canescens]